MADICIHSFVSGHVQGVWYCASTCEQAKALGLTGWVKNLSDGRVELIACGSEEAISALQGWLKEGPPLAQVTDIQSKIIPTEHFDDFVQLR